MNSNEKHRGVAIVSCEYPPFPGGIACYAGEIARQLHAAHIAITAIVPAYPDLPPPVDPPRYHRLFRHHRISPRAALATFRILTKQPRDTIVLGADVRSIFLIALWARITRRRYRVMVHGSEVMKFARQSLAGALARKAYLGADIILANSQATMDIFEKSFGPAQQGRVVHLGVDEAWFSPPSRSRFANAALAALPADARLFCSVGRVEARKGQLEAVLALAEAQKSGSGTLHYVVAGRIEDVAYASQITSAAANLGVAMVMPGRLDQDDIRLLYRRSIAHILSARNLATKIEGFGLVLLEAGAQHCPSITTRVGGIPEVVGDDNPLLFDSADVPGMAKAIRDLTCDSSFRDQEAARANGRARFFNWKRCAQLSFPELPLSVD